MDWVKQEKCSWRLSLSGLSQFNRKKNLEFIKDSEKGALLASYIQVQDDVCYWIQELDPFFQEAINYNN